MTGTSEPSAQQSGINHVPGVREAMFRVDDVSCDSALAVSSMRTGARTLAKRSAVVRLARPSDHRELDRLLLPIRAGHIYADNTGPRSAPRRHGGLA